MLNIPLYMRQLRFAFGGQISAIDRMHFKEKDALKPKINVRVIEPMLNNTAFTLAWEMQMVGAKAFVDDGRRTRKGNSINYRF